MSRMHTYLVDPTEVGKPDGQRQKALGLLRTWRYEVSKESEENMTKPIVQSIEGWLSERSIITTFVSDITLDTQLWRFEFWQVLSVRNIASSMAILDPAKDLLQGLSMLFNRHLKPAQPKPKDANAVCRKKRCWHTFLLCACISRPCPFTKGGPSCHQKYVWRALCCKIILGFSMCWKITPGLFSALGGKNMLS